MSETVLDDRDPAITYVDGVWRQGGNSREYRETSSWSISNEATATIDFYGSSIRVVGTIHRRDGVPENATLNLAFVLQGESSGTIIAQNRARFEQTHPPRYSIQLYASPQLTDNLVKRQLVIRNLTPDNQGFLCLDAVYIGGYTLGPGRGQSGSDPSPSSSTSTAPSPPIPPPTTVTTSTSTESDNTTSAPNTTTPIIPSASSESGSVLFAPVATDESSSLEGGSGSGSSSRVDSNQAGSKGGDKNRTVTGVLGGLVGLLALGILCWFIFVRRRNKRRRKVFGRDQQQTFASPYPIGQPVNLETAPSAAGSETHLLNAIGRISQNDHFVPSGPGTQMQEVFGGNIGGPGLSAVSAPMKKSAWSSSTASQYSGSALAGNLVDSTNRQEDDSASPPPYTTSV